MTDLYASYLGRSPDSVGYDNWLTALNNGSSRTEVRNGFAYSTEFQNKVNALCLATGMSGGIYYVLSDLQGTARALMNNNGSSSAVVARHDYLPFGEELGAGLGLRTTAQGYNASDTNRYKYGLLERDAVTGLDHTWWRKYENLSGRWTSPDPLQTGGGDPQSLNAYAYVQNDPVDLVDPNGLYAACIHEAMTKFLARLTGHSRRESNALAGFAGDKAGGADSDGYSATNWWNALQGLIGIGPSADIHFANEATLRAAIAAFPGYLVAGRAGRSAGYQQAAFVLHAIEDVHGAHQGFSLPLGHSVHSAVEWLLGEPDVDHIIGDDKFRRAANETFNVLGGLGHLSSSQMRNLIQAIIKGCKNEYIQVAKPSPRRFDHGGGGGGGDIRPIFGGGGGFGGFGGWSSLDLLYLMYEGGGGYGVVVSYKIGEIEK